MADHGPKRSCIGTHSQTNVVRLIFLIAVGMVGYLLYRLYFQRLWQQGKPGQIKIALVGLGLVFLGLAVTGRAPAIFALIGAAMTQVMRFAPLLIRFAPQLRRYLGGAAGVGSAAHGAGRGPGQESRVETPSLVMTLDHETGAIDGTVKVDRWRGRQLETLDIAELRAFRRYCLDHDGEALRLLDTYLARARADEWEPEHGAPDGDAAPPDDGTPSVSEAYGILGLEPGASRDAAVRAHRTLMGRLHPDKGGSTWLASKVNAAKRIVIDDIERRQRKAS